MLGSQHVIDPTDRSVVRSSLHDVRICACLLGNYFHHGNKSVDSVLALILCRFNHERLVEKEREIDSRSVIAIVEQAFRHIHCGNAR